MIPAVLLVQRAVMAEKVLSEGLSDASSVLEQVSEMKQAVEKTTEAVQLVTTGGLILLGAVGLFLAAKGDLLGKILDNLGLTYTDEDLEDFGVSTGTSPVTESILQAKDQILAPITQPEKHSAVAPSVKSESPSDMRASESMRNKIKNLEGLSLTAYKDESTYSIGYGHAGAKPGQRITKEQAEDYFNKDIARFESAVQENVKVPLTQNQFDALVSFTYNVGISAFKNSTLLKKLNRGDYAGAQAEFGRWVYGDNNKKLPALVKRRKTEADLFGKDVVKIAENTRKTDGKIISQTKTDKSIADKIVSVAEQVVTSTVSSGWCAKFVHDIMDKLGIKMKRFASAFMYIQGFKNHANFIEVSSGNVQRGDFVVYDRRGVHKHGHIFISDGGINSGWSDFRAKQQLKNPNEYGPVHVFRYLGAGITKQNYTKVQDLAQRNAVNAVETSENLDRTRVAVQTVKKPKIPKNTLMIAQNEASNIGVISFGNMDKLRVPKKA